MSRSEHEAGESALNREIAEKAALQARYDALLAAHLVSLRPAPEPASAVLINGVPVHREHSPVTLAIRNQAQGDTRLATYLRQRAKALRLENPEMSEDGIAALLSQWEVAEPSEGTP